MIAGHVASLTSEGGHADAPAAQRPDWDFAEWVAGQRVYRAGHLAILIGDPASVMRNEALDRIATHLRAKIADKPFAGRGDDVNEAGTEPDPCSLITRAEAEAVLEPLAFAPYRSLKMSTLAHGNGPSCTYYGTQRRTLVVHPTYYDGKERFDMQLDFGDGYRRRHEARCHRHAATRCPIGRTAMIGAWSRTPPMT